jgi:predicted acylesterase/phospholipase RssA
MIKNEKEKCNLVIAGHGLKSSFIVGVIEEIIKKYDIEIIVGASMGSFIGLYTANDKFETLKQHWEDIDFLKSIFMQKHGFSFLENILKKDSFYKLDRLAKTLEKEIDFNYWPTKLVITWTDYKTKEKIESIISEEKVHKKTLIQWILASLSISPIYPIIKTTRRMDDKLTESYGHNSAYSESIPIKTLFNLEENSSKKTFVVFSSRTENNLPNKNEISKDILNLFMDSSDMLFNNSFNLDIKYSNLKNLEKNNPNIKIIMPEFHILQGILDFDKHKIFYNIDYGRKCALKAMNEF